MSTAPRLNSGPSPEPIRQVLDRLARTNCDPRPVGPGKFESICPAHKGRRRNLSITTGTDGAVLVRCHHVDDSGQSCTAAAIVGALGLELRDLFVPVPGAKRAAAPKPKKKPARYESPRQAAEFLGKTLGTEPSGHWVYRDADGAAYAAVYRFDGADGKSYRPVSLDLDTGLWKIGDPPNWLPYRLPEIKDAERVYFVEGEKVAELARGLDLAATTTAHGAQSPHKTNLSSLAGKEVWIIPDNDPAGEAYAAKAAGLLVQLDPPARVKVLRLDLVEEGDDFEQWVEARKGQTAAAMRADLEARAGSVSFVSDPARDIPGFSPPESALEVGSVSFVSDPVGGLPDFSGPPRPIVTTLRPVPEFRPEMLPMPFRAWTDDIADRMQCAIEYPSVASIVSAATVIGRKVAIRPKRHDIWTVVPNLWGMIVGRPGVLKSPALEEAMKPLKRLIADAIERHEGEVAHHNRILMIAGAKRDGAKENLKKAAKGGKPDAELERLAALATATDEGGEPVLKRYQTNDPNAASLGVLLRDNPNGVLVYRDELTGLLRSLDKQGSEGDRSFYLEGWNGNGAFDLDRIGRGHVRIKAVCLSILGGIQPGPLATYLRAAVNGQGDDGLISRFQMAVYPDRLEQFQIVDRAPNAGAKNRAYDVFKAIDGLDPADLGCEMDDHGDIPYIRFHEDAQILFYSWLTDLQREKLSGDEPEALESHFSKYRSLMPSLALIFHIVDIVDGASRGPVSLDAARRAAAWCDLLEQHARRIYQAGGDGDMGPARGLAEKLTQSLPNPFTARDVSRKGWSGLTTTEDVDRAIGILEEHDWVRPVEVPSGPRGGAIDDRVSRQPGPRRGWSMKYLLDFLTVEADEKPTAAPPGSLTKLTEPPPEVGNPGDHPRTVTDKTDETDETQPDPLDALSGPRRTAWGTLAWSDPDEPALELFGPPPPRSNHGGRS